MIFWYLIINFCIYLFIKGSFFVPQKMVNVAPHTTKLAIFHTHQIAQKIDNITLFAVKTCIIKFLLANVNFFLKCFLRLSVSYAFILEGFLGEMQIVTLAWC